MTISKPLSLFVLAFLLLLPSCVNTINRGHLKEDEAISSIKPGITTEPEALKLLGSPSSESTFGPKTWYYVSSIRQTRSLLPTRVIDQHVIEIAFNDAGTVASLREYGLKDGKEVEIVSRISPSEGQQLGFFQQVFSNLGRFNDNSDNGASNSHTHGNTGAPGGPGGTYR